MLFDDFLSDCTSLERFWSSCCLWRLVQKRFWALQSFLYTLLDCLLYSSMHLDSFWASLYSCNFCGFISYCRLCPQLGWTPALTSLTLCLKAELVLFCAFFVPCFWSLYFTALSSSVFLIKFFYMMFCSWALLESFFFSSKFRPTWRAFFSLWCF